MTLLLYIEKLCGAGPGHSSASMYFAKDPASLDKAQWEFKEYEIDIENVVGKVAYQYILWENEHIIAKRLVNNIIETCRQVVSLFSS